MNVLSSLFIGRMNKIELNLSQCRIVVQRKRKCSRYCSGKTVWHDNHYYALCERRTLTPVCAQCIDRFHLNSVQLVARDASSPIWNLWQSLECTKTARRPPYVQCLPISEILWIQFDSIDTSTSVSWKCSPNVRVKCDTVSHSMYSAAHTIAPSSVRLLWNRYSRCQWPDNIPVERHRPIEIINVCKRVSEQFQQSNESNARERACCVCRWADVDAKN